MVDEILENKKAWELFCDFFRDEKCHYDWTDDEIDFSRNDDDFKEFVMWLIEKHNKE